MVYHSKGSQLLHLRPDTQPLLFFHPSHVINLINLDSPEEDDNDDDKNVTGQKGDTSTRRRQLV